MQVAHYLKLTLDYRIPSLNVTKRQHWAQQYQEKQRAFDALQSALLAIASDPLTLTTSLEVAKTCSTAFDTLRSYRTTAQNLSNFKHGKSGSEQNGKKKRKSS